MIFHTLHTWIIWESDTGILYLSHMNHIGMLYRNHMFKNTHMWKLLTCGEDINVATIQLLCGYHTTPMWLPYRNYCVPHGSCMVGTWDLYGSHMLPNTVLMCRGFLSYSSHMATIQLLCGYHTASVWLPYSSHVVHSNSNTATIHNSTNMQGSKSIPMWLPYNSGMATIPCVVRNNSHMATIHSTHMQGAEGISMFLSYVDTIWDL